MLDLKFIATDLRDLHEYLTTGGAWQPTDVDRLRAGVAALDDAVKQIAKLSKGIRAVGREWGSPDWIAAEKAGKVFEFERGEWVPPDEE